MNRALPPLHVHRHHPLHVIHLPRPPLVTQVLHPLHVNLALRLVHVIPVHLHPHVNHVQDNLLRNVHLVLPHLLVHQVLLPVVIQVLLHLAHQVLLHLVTQAPHHPVVLVPPLHRVVDQIVDQRAVANMDQEIK